MKTQKTRELITLNHEKQCAFTVIKIHTGYELI